MRQCKLRKIRKRQTEILAELEALAALFEGAAEMPSYYIDKFLRLKSEAAVLQFELENQ